MKQTYPIFPCLWIFLTLLFVGFNGSWQLTAVLNLFVYMNVTCNINETMGYTQYPQLTVNLTNVTSDYNECRFDFISTIVLECLSVFFVTLGAIVWGIISTHYIIKTKKLQLEVVRLRGEAVLQRQENIRNRIIGRPNNDLPAYTELPNERGQLLTQSQLPNYQATVPIN